MRGLITAHLSLGVVLCLFSVLSSVGADLPSCDRARCHHCNVDFIKTMCSKTCAPCSRSAIHTVNGMSGKSAKRKALLNSMTAFSSPSTRGMASERLQFAAKTLTPPEDDRTKTAARKSVPSPSRTHSAIAPFSSTRIVHPENTTHLTASTQKGGSLAKLKPKAKPELYKAVNALIGAATPKRHQPFISQQGSPTLAASAQRPQAQQVFPQHKPQTVNAQPSLGQPQSQTHHQPQAQPQVHPQPQSTLQTQPQLLQGQREPQVVQQPHQVQAQPQFFAQPQPQLQLQQLQAQRASQVWFVQPQAQPQTQAAVNTQLQQVANGARPFLQPAVRYPPNVHQANLRLPVPRPSQQQQQQQQQHMLNPFQSLFTAIQHSTPSPVFNPFTLPTFTFPTPANFGQSSGFGATIPPPPPPPLPLLNQARPQPFHIPQPQQFHNRLPAQSSIPQQFPQVVQQIPQAVQQIPQTIQQIPQTIQQFPQTIQQIPQPIQQIPQMSSVEQQQVAVPVSGAQFVSRLQPAQPPPPQQQQQQLVTPTRNLQPQVQQPQQPPPVVAAPPQPAQVAVTQSPSPSQVQSIAAPIQSSIDSSNKNIGKTFFATGKETPIPIQQCPRQPNWEPCIGKEVANERFSACCQRLGQGCASLCSYDATLTTIQLGVLTGRCPLNKVADMMVCASGYEDATPCCEAFNVFEPGFDHCRPYCNPAAGLPQGGMLSEQYKCLGKLGQIQRCFYITQRP